MSRRFLVAFAVFACLSLFGISSARAQFISGNDLFLAPSDVPDAFYTPTVVSPGGSFTFSGSDVVPGGTLQSVQILPLLNPNSLTSDGSYDTSSLAAINVSNYSSAFAMQPNIDYFATLISGNSSTLTFNTEGQYFVNLTASSGGVQTSKLVEVTVGDSFLEDPGAGFLDEAGVGRIISAPSTDLVVISTGDPNDGGALADAQTQLPGAVTASSLQQVKDKIVAAYNANGQKKISVTLVGHGRPGSIKMGTQRINNFGDGTMTPDAFQQMISPYVNRIDFYSCDIASGANGLTFLNTMSSVGQASGYNEPITVTTKYFDASATARLIVVTAPEPGSLWLLLPASGLVVVMLGRRRSIV